MNNISIDKGKEFDPIHGLNMFDFHARQYDPVVARFTSVDPHAEKKPWLTPYHYCSNNPANRVDPDGKQDQWGSEYYGAHGVRTVRSKELTIHKKSMFLI